MRGEDDFRSLVNYLTNGYALFADVMDKYGKSDLSAIYKVDVLSSHSQINAAFIPKKPKNRDGEKISAYYRFTTTELDLEASTRSYQPTKLR